MFWNKFPGQKHNSRFILSADNQMQICALGHSRKHPCHPHWGNWKLTPLPPSDVTFTIIRNNFVSLPLRTAEISSVGGVWIFSGTTHFQFPKRTFLLLYRGYLASFENRKFCIKWSKFCIKFKQKYPIGKKYQYYRYFFSGIGSRFFSNTATT
jgi:hypothetical protein